MQPLVNLGCLLLLLVSSRLAHGYLIQFEDCGAGEVKEVRTEACNSHPCKIVKGKDIQVEIDFLPADDYEKVTFEVATVVFGFDMDLPVEDNQACGKFLNCPVKKDQLATFAYKLDVDNSYPSMEAPIKFTLKSENKVVACARSTVELVDPDEDAHQEL